MELETRQKIIHHLQATNPVYTSGAYGELINKAQSTIRSMNLDATPAGAMRRPAAGAGAGAGAAAPRRRGSTGAAPRTPSSSRASPEPEPAPNGSSPTSTAAMHLSDDLSGLLAGLAGSPTPAGRRKSSGAADGNGEALVLPDKAQRDALFDRFDVNGNGGLSLAEIDKAVLEVWPHFNNKPALVRSYKAADVTGDGFITRKEFRLLLVGIDYFNSVWSRFESLDADGDRRLSLEEFHIGCIVLGLRLKKQESTAAFREMDADQGGYVLFDEFCSWCVRHNMAANGDDEVEEGLHVEDLDEDDLEEEELEPERSGAVSERSPIPVQAHTATARVDHHRDGSLVDRFDQTRRDLTAEEKKLTRQTAAIGKTIRDAISGKRSLNGKGMVNVRSVFAAIDKDGSGELDYDEFRLAIKRLGLGLTEVQVTQCVEVLDTDGDGVVSLDEFMVLVKEKEPVHRVGTAGKDSSVPERGAM